MAETYNGNQTTRAKQRAQTPRKRNRSREPARGKREVLTYKLKHSNDISTKLALGGTSAHDDSK